ncbi:site-specific tyrosine recombinase/integron integrase [Lederbergia lenta]|uniref:Site-specific tyrosine recombinase XerC n=1 Tax=Lederbergia lenta TaxID=1467 RepID=A0A2X4WA90_LEDLE|nr:site-specific tyrosine recombinase/integron integrase [Lederbergia lenta]SQI59943.1 site-specific tyrosine recombinase XerC [Lederbergia lenta]
MKNYWELTKDLPNEINQEIIGEFLLSLKVSNRSKGTIIVYRRFLEQFFVEMKEPYTSLTSNTILEWFKKNEDHLSEAYLRLRLSIISSFYKFCLQEEYVDSSPIKSRWFPRLPQSLPKYLEKEDIAKIRNQSELTSLRNQVLVEFMLTTGCRVREVSELNREEVDFENRTARVVGKGKKIRYVHFTEKCAFLLERYIIARNRYHKAQKALFLTSSGRRLSVRTIQYVIKKIGEGAKLSTNLHPHRFRHTFATELLAKGADLSFIGDELGHSDVGTTQIYARLPKREVISLYRKYMG